MDMIGCFSAPGVINMRIITRKQRATGGIVTQVHFARKATPTTEVVAVAEREGISCEQLMREIAHGRAVIPSNVRHENLEPVGIGIALSCKINANIGASSEINEIEDEIEKLKVAISYGADTVMDLSCSQDAAQIRRVLLEKCNVPFGTVPIYEASEKAGSLKELSSDLMIKTIEEHAKNGVDFVTVHCGVLREHIELAKDRVTGIVSRGGAILAQWMLYHDRQNPLYERFDEILGIARRYDLTLSLGDGLRPGSIADASDKAQFAELEVIASLADRCREAEVQFMVEGPGHIPIDQIQMNVERQRELCKDGVFYVLGPVVTDIAAGYDHITGAIGGAIAAFYGASLLCYVTPKEHLGLPDSEDVRQGTVAFKIAAHAADIARGRTMAKGRDLAISSARYNFDWPEVFKNCLDPERAKQYFDDSTTESCIQRGRALSYCTMCGPRFCAMRLHRQIKEGGAGRNFSEGGRRRK